MLRCLAEVIGRYEINRKPRPQWELASRAWVRAMAFLPKSRKNLTAIVLDENREKSFQSDI